MTIDEIERHIEEFRRKMLSGRYDVFCTANCEGGMIHLDMSVIPRDRPQVLPVPHKYFRREAA